MKKSFLLTLVGVLLTASIFIACLQDLPGSKGKEFIIANFAEPQSLDPSQITGVPEHRIYKALFEGLVRADAKTCKAIPGVAESWTFNNDNSVITFKIRQGITWSDGTPITSQQIVDSWLYHLNPNTASHYAYMMGMVVKGAQLYNEKGGKPSDVAIRAVDRHTFEVTLVGPTPYALDMMSHYAFSPLPMHIIKRHGKEWIKPENIVCNGPFVLKEHIPNSRVVVVPNDDYWDRKNVHLTQITFLPNDDRNTGYQAYRNREIDWATDIPVALIDELKLRKDFHVSTQMGTYYMYINNRDHAALRDVRVRKALSMGFDRQELCDKVLKTGVVPAYSISPPMNDYIPAQGAGYNVTEAKRLLAEAGFPGGQGLPSFSIMYNTAEQHKLVCEYLQEAWKKNLGINVTLENLEWATYLEQRKTSRMQIARAGWIADYMDPQNFLDLIISNGGNNDGHYSNAEYDRLIRQAAAMPDGPERNRIMRQAEDIAITQDQCMIPVYYYVSFNLIDLDKWEGWHTNPLNQQPYTGIKRK